MEQLQEEIELMRQQLEQLETTVKEKDRDLVNAQERVRARIIDALVYICRYVVVLSSML